MKKILVLLIVVSTTGFSQSIKTAMKYNGQLYTNYNRAEKVMELLKGDSLTVKAYSPKGKTYFVITADTVGWVYEGNVEGNFDLLLLRDDTKAMENKGMYWIGMSQSEVTMNLGMPTAIVSRMAGSWGKTETWYYEKKQLYIVIDDEVVSSFYFK